MTGELKRLDRLHVLRAQMAEVASRERKQAEQALEENIRAAVSLRAISAPAMALTAPKSDWREAVSALRFAGHCKTSLDRRCEMLRLRQHATSAAERDALLAREQTASILNARKQQETELRERRIQKELDDAFAMAQARVRETTRL